MVFSPPASALSTNQWKKTKTVIQTDTRTPGFIAALFSIELPDVQVGFRKGRGTRDQIANIRWIIKKSKRVPEKQLFLLY